MTAPPRARARVTFDANPDWVDQVVVDEAVAGRPTPRPLTDGERAVAIRELARQGLTAAAISTRLHTRHAMIRKVLDDEHRRQRAVYGDDMLAATAAIITAAHSRDPHALQTAVDRALALQQPAGEDPVTWLAGALAAQIDPTLPLEQRIPWAPKARQ